MVAFLRQWVRAVANAAGQVQSRPTLRMVPRYSAERGGDSRVARLVPWIFRNEVANAAELQSCGEPAVLANVETSEGRELGIAACNLKKGGSTTVNVFARLLCDNVSLSMDSGFFAQRVSVALKHRTRIFGEQSFYRLLNGEGDYVPGVICDRYGDVLCVQFTAAAMENLLLEEVLDALSIVTAPQAIVVRCDERFDRQLELAPMKQPEVVRGIYTGPTKFPEEHGLVFEADLLCPELMSGRYFSERLQRQLIAKEMVNLSSKEERNVLSLFSESVGVLCAKHGAQVTELVNDDRSHQTQCKLAHANQCLERIQFVNFETPDMSWLRHGKEGTFDIVTLQPPALAPSYGRLEEGMQKYTSWIAFAAGAVRPGGLLLVACRSRTMTAVRFLRCVNLGMWSARRKARIVHRSACAPNDFPVHAALPNTNSMQMLVLRVH